MITNCVDVVVHYDNDQLVASQRIAAPDAEPRQEHAAQCLMVEIIRDILSTGLTIDEYNTLNGQEDPTEWDAWWAARQAAAFERVVFNVSADYAPLLPQGLRDNAANQAASFFEHGYPYTMSMGTNESRITFTRTGGM